jgi:hypothetical protein
MFAGFRKCPFAFLGGAGSNPWMEPETYGIEYFHLLEIILRRVGMANHHVRRGLGDKLMPPEFIMR